jgi:hypothetical protein
LYEHDRGENIIIFYQHYGLVILAAGILEGDAVSVHVREVLLCFLGCARPKTFVVLDLPSVVVLGGSLPSLKLWKTEKGNLLSALGSLNTGKTD